MCEAYGRKLAALEGAASLIALGTATRLNGRRTPDVVANQGGASAVLPNVTVAVNNTGGTLTAFCDGSDGQSKRRFSTVVLPANTRFLLVCRELKLHFRDQLERLLSGRGETRI